MMLGFGVSIPLRAAESFITGYAGSWSNVSGQPAEFYLSGEKEDPNAMLTIYDVLTTPRATLNVPLRTQTLAPTNLEPWKTSPTRILKISARSLGPNW